MMRLSRDSERGAALLSVLMIVAVMSVAATLAVSSLARSVDVTSALSARGAAIWQVRSAEALGAVLIGDLAQTTGEGLTLEVIERIDPFVFPLEGAVVTARLSEATNCFNLNALVSADTGLINADEVAAYSELLVAIGLSRAEAQTLSDSLADWFDKDSSPRVNGADAAYYEAMDWPHLPSGQILNSLSELRAVAGYTADVRQVLGRLVCVRPSLKQSVLNMNTLRSRDAPLLVALVSADLTPDTARQIIDLRPVGGWRDQSEVLDLEPLRNISPVARKDDAISLRTSHVQLDIEVRGEDRVATGIALYKWPKAGPAELLWRGQGESR